ncbi:MAG: tRNA uridine-5-carboxymethylaminomethyl(34) synthesis GTPase MnmE [Anaerolineae bacterium]|nr:tRNA uridine-5-carboxymethylaminomethyl(34) synthesis GTPase MnmE [Gemmatimonadaceae bacterium]
MSTLPLPRADDTIVAIATAPGRGAIAVVRMSGPDATRIAERVIADFSAIALRVAHLASIRHPTGDTLLDHALVTRFQGPRSYTGEDVVEVSVHGGAVVPALVLSALISAGARQALPGEFTRRAVANGRMDLLQAEAVADLVDARSRMAHRVAIGQLDGGLSHRTAELRDAILNLEALIAYDIDFPEEDQSLVDRARVANGVTRAIDALDDLLATGDAGEMLHHGALVVIGGAPNAGKSSLFNALIGRQRAIVTNIPGTTRDAIEMLVEIRGWPVRLVDTAGLRESTDIVERLGIEISERYLADADVVLLCAESLDELVVLSRRADDLTSAPHLVLQTKSDLPRPSRQLEAKEYVPVSALTGDGLDDLTEKISSLLSERFGAAVGEAPLLTRERHRQAVTAARMELLAFREAWANNDPPSSVASIHLREAAHHLAELIGSVDVEDILGRVFSTFCVGK